MNFSHLLGEKENEAREEEPTSMLPEESHSSNSSDTDQSRRAAEHIVSHDNEVNVIVSLIIMMSFTLKTELVLLRLSDPN